MMLPRKRHRPNPAEPSSAADTAPTPRSHAESTSLKTSDSHQQQMPPPKSGNEESNPPTHPPLRKVKKAQSWYGSWPKTPKASASTSVARENIFGGSIRSKKAPDLSRFDTKKDSDTNSTHSTARTESGLSKIPENGMNKNTAEPNKGQTDTSMPQGQDDPKTKPDNQNNRPVPNPEEAAPTTPQRPTTSSGWLGWWSRTPFTETQTGSTPQAATQDEQKPSDPPRPSTPPAQTGQPQGPQVDTSQDPPPSASWFGFWSYGTQSNTKPDVEPAQTSQSDQNKTSQDVVMQDAPPPSAPAQKHEPAPKAGTTWAFWSKDSPRSPHGMVPEAEAGEIAVIGEGSEQHPKPMTEVDMTPSKAPKGRKEGQPGAKSTWRKNNKRLRPPSMDIDSQSVSSGTSTPQEATQPQPQPQPQPNIQIRVDSSSKSISDSESITKAPENLLLPSFSSTYHMKENPSIIKQITQILLRTQQPPANHVSRIKDPPKIRKAMAIGVHGLFPATYLRPMIGQPTGTSLRFASLCADSIRRWADSHGCPDCEIEKVALEGEGKINERVDNLWTLMLNWIDHIRKADLILIACHSQGVPVGIMLLEKLINLNIINNAKIGVCAMAGVALGPFPDYRSGILMGSAAELWDFGNPETTNAQRFQGALKRVLDYGARISFIGSIDDQVVPMESAIYSPANHPYIYRAVFIDGRVHAPDFIAHLVGFALKLRNLGLSDNGLIRELSTSLAGSLYSGEGHSRIYYDSQVYDLAISHTLETSNVPAPKCVIQHRPPSTQPNPYYLPFIMGELLKEDYVKTELRQETEELLRQYNEWNPLNKALKDVKLRLEALRSKL